MIAIDCALLFLDTSLRNEQVGDKAPDFTLKTAVSCTARVLAPVVQRPLRPDCHVSTGSSTCSMLTQDGKQVKLSSYQGFLGKPVVLYFYPSDDSPGGPDRVRMLQRQEHPMPAAALLTRGLLVLQAAPSRPTRSSRPSPPSRKRAQSVGRAGVSSCGPVPAAMPCA
jgi:AhpC/TSA family